MATKKRQQYTAEFKAKVVLESLQRDTTIEAVRQKYGVSTSMIHRWREEFNQHLPLAPVEQEIKAALSRAEVLHQDETGLYVAGKRHWMHVSATEQLTHYAVHPKRGKAALEAIGILADFQGVSVHDGWGTYWHYQCQHALCNVHHLRDLTFLEEEQQQAWAAEMKDLLLDSKAAVEQARAEGRSPIPLR